jgi:hypothetical protein
LRVSAGGKRGRQQNQRTHSSHRDLRN